MKFTRSAGWVFFGLALVASGAYAQGDTGHNTSSKAKASAKNPKSVAKEIVEPEANALQAQGEAEENARVEQEARQRAKAETEAETRKQAETEAHEKPLRDADELIKNGKPADAYILLEPLEFDRSGEVRFDYLLGIAALDSGKPDKATLAFERVLTMDPNFAGARLDMARAYYQLGDMPRAKAEFEVVLTQNPPEAARATIQKYLDTIAAREAVKQTSFSAYVEGTVGHDSNVNNATSQTQMDVYLSPTSIIPNFPIPAGSIKTADDYLGVAAGGEVNHSINPGLAVFAGADLRNRGNMSKTAYSSLNVDGRAGVILGSNADSFRLGVQGGQYTLAGARNRDSLGLNAEWRRAFNPADQLTVFGQAVQYRYVDAAMKIYDFDLQAIGAGWLHVLADGKSALFGSLNYGTEKDVAPGGRPDGAKRFSGLRIGGQTPVNERTELFASAGGQVGDYDKVSTLFSLVPRADRQYDLAVGANWHWDKLWTVRPQLTYSRTNSNIVLYSNDRTDVSATIRRDFK